MLYNVTLSILMLAPIVGLIGFGVFLVSNWKGGSNTPKYVLFEIDMQKWEVLLVDDSRTIMDISFKVTGNLKIKNYCVFFFDLAWY